MKPSKLVESCWNCMSFHRGTYGNTEVLAAAYGPYESKMTAKSNYSKCNVEVVISDVENSADHSVNERILSELFSSVIKVKEYPYLTVMICVQIFVKDFNFLSACINAGFEAVKRANLQIACDVVAKDFLNEGSLATLAIVPKSDEILLSVCEKNLPFEEFERIVLELERE